MYIFQREALTSFSDDFFVRFSVNLAVVLRFLAEAFFTSFAAILSFFLKFLTFTPRARLGKIKSPDCALVNPSH